VHHPLVTSAVIGATTLDQLTEQVDAAEQGPLPDDVLAELDKVHTQFPSPTP
jgi:aryl-alcohol dehydrogenase-like predicted oxidoreductase